MSFVKLFKLLKLLILLGNPLKTLASVSQKIAPFIGPAGNVLNFILVQSDENDKTEEYFKHISEQLEKIDAKLDAVTDYFNQISSQLNSLDSKIATSTIKITTEVKFQGFFEKIEEISAEVNQFETIVSGYYSNATSLILRLDSFIEAYKRKELEFKLIEKLESSNSASKSLIKEILELFRQYQKDPLSSTVSSPIQILYDIYVITFTSILKGNILLESSSNLKAALLGIHYEEDKRFLFNKKSKDLEKFFNSVTKALSYVNDDDLEAFIGLETNGNNNEIKMINVLQYFWEAEHLLSGKTNTCSDECSHFQSRQYSNDGCSGAVHDCQSVSNSVKLLRQNPQNDRIYNGYIYNGKEFGDSIKDDHRIETKVKFSKKSFAIILFLLNSHLGREDFTVARRVDAFVINMITYFQSESFTINQFWQKMDSE